MIIYTSWPHMLLVVIRIGLLVLVGLSILLFFTQSSYVYYPSRGLGLLPSYFRLPFEEVLQETNDGETIAGWFIPLDGSAQNAHPTVLFCKGNGGTISDWLETAASLNAIGVNVLIFDYRGYGNSTGKPDEEGTYEDGRAMWRFLTRTKGILPENIVIIGRSLGGAIAARLAAEFDPAGLITEASFTSAPDMAARLFPYLPARLLCRFRYDNVKALRDTHCPVIIAHSPGDSTVPFNNAEALFAAANPPKRMITLNGSHNHGYFEDNPEYRNTIKEFIFASTRLGTGKTIPGEKTPTREQSEPPATP